MDAWLAAPRLGTGGEPGYQASMKFGQGAVLMLTRALSQPGLGALAEMDKKATYPLRSSFVDEPSLQFRRGSRVGYVSS